MKDDTRLLQAIHEFNEEMGRRGDESMARVLAILAEDERRYIEQHGGEPEWGLDSATQELE
jgi:hypothetical protein